MFDLSTRYVEKSLAKAFFKAFFDTGCNRTWAQIAKFFRKKSKEYEVAVPYLNTIYPSHLPDRRDGFIQNLRVFSSEQQLALLHELCDITNKKINSTPLKKLIVHHCTKKAFAYSQVNNT
jgi:hypothetical protein